MRDDPNLKPLPNVPMTLEEAAGPVFKCDYGSLRNKVKYLIAQGCPITKEGRRYIVYPKHVEAWRISRLNPDARRHLRDGGYECSDDGNLPPSAKVSINREGLRALQDRRRQPSKGST